MAKKSFSFRIDPDNMEFLNTIKAGGDRQALVVNQAIRVFRKQLQLAARYSYVFVPTMLFKDEKDGKI